MEKKFANDFEGFTHLIVDDCTLNNVFDKWLSQAKFGEKFTNLYTITTTITKENGVCNVKYVLNFTTYNKYRDIDIDYIFNCIKYEMPYNNVTTSTNFINTEIEKSFWKKLSSDNGNYNHEIVLNIPFNL